MKKLVIAIDGPAAAGKSTAGKALAARLGYRFVDTGALYRAIAWLADREQLAEAPPAAIGALARAAEIRLEGDAGRTRVIVAGRDVAGEIRSERIGQLSSRLSALPEVRAALLALQRRIGDAGGVVMDGRDIGTVVFPEAEVKFFVCASPEARAGRRHAELLARGLPSEETRVLAELRERDARDAGRDVAPLQAADDAVVIDTTDLTPQQVLDRMLAVVESRQDALRPRREIEAG